MASRPAGLSQGRARDGPARTPARGFRVRRLFLDTRSIDARMAAPWDVRGVVPAASPPRRGMQGSPSQDLPKNGLRPCRMAPTITPPRARATGLLLFQKPCAAASRGPTRFRPAQARCTARRQATGEGGDACTVAAPASRAPHADMGAERRPPPRPKKASFGPAPPGAGLRMRDHGKISTTAPPRTESTLGCFSSDPSGNRLVRPLAPSYRLTEASRAATPLRERTPSCRMFETMRAVS